MRSFGHGKGLVAAAFLGALTCAFGQGCRETEDASKFEDAGAPLDDGSTGPGRDPRPLPSPETLLKEQCASATGKANRIPAYMLFVVDGSGSMVHDNKWVAAVDALKAVFDELKGLSSSSLAVGLTVFADRQDFTISDFSAGPYSKIDVPLGFVDIAKHASLRARVETTEPYGGTPTYEVLSGQYPLLSQYVPQSPIDSGGKKVIVFMSDGVPDPDMPAGQNEQPYTLKLADEWAKKKSDSILTFSVGIGSLSAPEVYDPKFMAKLAQAGATARAGCDPNETVDAKKMCHFQITPGGKTKTQLTSDFLGAINDIRIQAASCEFKLDRTSGNLDPTKVNVLYSAGDGTKSVLPQSNSDGWVFDDPANPQKVLLTGPTCDRVKHDPNAKVDIVIGCLTLVR